MKPVTRFWMAVAGCAVGLLVFWRVVVSPLSAKAELETRACAGLQAERSGYLSREGEPIAEVERSLQAERKKLAELGASLAQAELSLPRELEPDEKHDKLYYQQKLAELTAKALGSGIQFASKDSPLGFPKDIGADAVGEYLARIGVAHRFVDAGVAAGVKAVSATRHPGLRTVQKEGTSALQEIPLEVSFATDELGLVRLVQELTVRGRFLAIKKLKVEVKDPASGAFEATVELAGVRPAPRTPSAEGDSASGRAPLPGGEGAPEAPDSGGGVPVRTRKRF